MHCSYMRITHTACVYRVYPMFTLKSRPLLSDKSVKCVLDNRCLFYKGKTLTIHSNFECSPPRMTQNIGTKHIKIGADFGGDSKNISNSINFNCEPYVSVKWFWVDAIAIQYMDSIVRARKQKKTYLSMWICFGMVRKWLKADVKGESHLNSACC